MHAEVTLSWAVSGFAIGGRSKHATRGRVFVLALSLTFTRVRVFMCPHVLHVPVLCCLPANTSQHSK